MNDLINVPKLDVSPLFGNDESAILDVARNIDDACRGCGFFYAANHGINLALLEEETTRFHREITDDEKWELAINAYNSSNLRSRNGYYLAIPGKKANESYCYLNPSFSEMHPHISSQVPMHEVNVWPKSTRHPGLREFYEAYYWDVFNLSSSLLAGFAVALGKDKKFFDRYFTELNTLSAVSLIRYPFLENYPPVKVAEDGTQLSFERHQDVSLITVLYQTPVPNLQALTEDGYRNIPPSGDCFLVNCGTYMEHITNGYYRAPWHRVAFINQERLSIPFFVNLDYHSVVEPFVPHTSRASEKAPIAYGEYFQFGFKKLIADNGQT